MVRKFCLVLALCFLMGCSYIPGIGPLEETPEVKALIPAAQKGDVDAQVKVASAYYFGEKAPKDYKKALYWYSKAANAGNAKAAFYLGGMYMNGEGTQVNHYRTIYWWKKVAESDFFMAPFTQMALGELYYFGQKDVAKDRREAEKWFRKLYKEGYGDIVDDLKKNGIKYHEKALDRVVERIPELSSSPQEVKYF